MGLAAAEGDDVDESMRTPNIIAARTAGRIRSVLQSGLSSARERKRRAICEPSEDRAWTQRRPQRQRRRRMVIASTTADTMTIDTPIAVDTPMGIADDVPAAPPREATPAKRTDVGGGGAAAEADEQQLKRSREIWEHVKEEQYEGTDAASAVVDENANARSSHRAAAVDSAALSHSDA